MNNKKHGIAVAKKIQIYFLNDSEKGKLKKSKSHKIKFLHTYGNKNSEVK